MCMHYTEIVTKDVTPHWIDGKHALFYPEQISNMTSLIYN